MFFSNLRSIRSGSHALALLLSTGLAIQAKAAEIYTDPGDYVPLPAGTDLMVLYMQHNQHDAYHADGRKQPTELRMEANLGLLRYVRYMEMSGITIDPQIAIPFGEIKLEKDFGGLNSTSASGIGDPLVGAAAWLYNDPKSSRYLAVLAVAALPLGDYDGDRGPINIGQNRWRGILQVGYVTPITQRSMLELITEYAVYGSNDDYFGMAQKRDDSYAFQTHLSYALLPSTRVSLSYFHDFAGETRLDGIAQADEANNSRWLLTAATSFSADTQMLVQYGETIKVENGPFESRRLNLRVVKMF